MIRIAIILLLAGLVGNGVLAQDKQPAKVKPTDKMTLRMNTRDRMMIIKRNNHEFKRQIRQNYNLQRRQVIQQRRMMMLQRHNRQQQMHQQAPRRATERQMMQQRQRQINQKSMPGGHR